MYIKSKWWKEIKLTSLGEHQICCGGVDTCAFHFMLHVSAYTHLRDRLSHLEILGLCWQWRYIKYILVISPPKAVQLCLTAHFIAMRLLSSVIAVVELLVATGGTTPFIPHATEHLQSYHYCSVSFQYTVQFLLDVFLHHSYHAFTQHCGLRSNGLHMIIVQQNSQGIVSAAFRN